MHQKPGFSPPACAPTFFDLAIPLPRSGKKSSRISTGPNNTPVCACRSQRRHTLILHDVVADHMRNVLSKTASRCSYTMHSSERSRCPRCRRRRGRAWQGGSRSLPWSPSVRGAGNASQFVSSSWLGVWQGQSPSLLPSSPRVRGAGGGWWVAECPPSWPVSSSSGVHAGSALVRSALGVIIGGACGRGLRRRVVPSLPLPS
ncbi:hypothetical protein EDB85DRAFT_1945106, partial [Lactarius pseudohatsudake]